MVRVVFDKDGLVMAAKGGDRLLDLCDEVGATIAFSCRDASCATCLIEVVNGEGLLQHPDISELRLLARMNAGPMQRLACQAKIADGEGDLHVVPAGVCEP